MVPLMPRKLPVDLLSFWARAGRAIYALCRQLKFLQLPTVHSKPCHPLRQKEGVLTGKSTDRLSRSFTGPRKKRSAR